MKNLNFKILLFLISIFFYSTKIYANKEDLSKFKRLNDEAFELFEKDQIKSAEEKVYELLAYSKNKKTNIYTINAYTLLGIINKNRAFYITSLENNIKALNLAEKIKDTGRISACLNNIGTIYQLQNNYEQAIKYFSKSLTIEEKRKNPLQKSIRYYNLGDSYKKLDSLDLALSYFNNSLIIEEKYKNNDGIVYAYLGIAEVYLEMKNYFQAKMVLDKIKIKSEEGQVEKQIIFNKLLGQYHLETQKLNEALTFLNLADELSQKNENFSYFLEIYLLQIAVFEKQNEILEANKIYKKYIKLSNELSSSEIKNKIDDLSYQNELTKKELEIKLVLEERQLEKDLRIFGQKITWFVIFILILAVSLILLGVKRLTKNNK
jgi:tetratricopeptide (TPR) repeat protein